MKARKSAGAFVANGGERWSTIDGHSRMSDSPPTGSTAPTKVEVPEGTRMLGAGAVGTGGSNLGGRTPRPGYDMSTGRATRPMTPDEAIHAQEIQHMRVFVYFVIALAALCVGAVIGLGGERTARIVMC